MDLDEELASSSSRMVGMRGVEVRMEEVWVGPRSIGTTSSCIVASVFV